MIHIQDACMGAERIPFTGAPQRRESPPDVAFHHDSALRGLPHRMDGLMGYAFRSNLTYG